MSRIRIRTTSNEKSGVDDRSFKLGYQVAFREAEQVTMERLEKEYYEPLRKKLADRAVDTEKLLQLNKTLEHKIQALESKIAMMEENGNTFGAHVGSSAILKNLIQHPVAPNPGTIAEVATRMAMDVMNKDRDESFTNALEDKDTPTTLQEWMEQMRTGSLNE